MPTLCIARRAAYLWTLLVGGAVGCGPIAAEAIAHNGEARPADDDERAADRVVTEGAALFTHVWAPGDPRSKGGDGLGWGAQAMVNVPIVQDKLAVSGSFAWRSTPGWVDSVNNAALKDQNDYEQRGGRVALLWTPTPDLSVKLAGIWQ